MPKCRAYINLAFQRPDFGKQYWWGQLLICEGEHWLVESPYACVVSACMSQDLYNSLQLVSLSILEHSTDISGSCMCSNNLCKIQRVTHLQKVQLKYYRFPPSPSSPIFACLPDLFVSYSSLHQVTVTPKRCESCCLFFFNPWQGVVFQPHWIPRILPDRLRWAWQSYRITPRTHQSSAASWPGWMVFSSRFREWRYR